MARVMVIGGYSPSLLNFRGALLQSMVEAGHQVVACGPEDDAGVRQGLKSMGVEFQSIPVQRAGIGPVADLRTWRTIGAKYRALQPDIVLAYTAKPVIYSCLARLLCRKPKVYSLITGLGYGFGEDSPRQRWVGRLVKALYRAAMRFSSGVVFQNPDDLAVFRQQRLLPEGLPARVVNGSGVDLAHFRPHPLPDEPRFLLIARLLVEKGVREYVAAARVVKQTYPDAVFELAGPLDSNPGSVSKSELQAWVDEGLLVYSGELQDVRPALARCSVFVLPSYYREGTPRTLLEAMATGRPIITTDAPGCRETVEHGVNGLLVPPRDAGALAEAMIQMIEAPDEEVQRMADASLAMAREKFDVHKVNQQMLEIMGI